MNGDALELVRSVRYLGVILRDDMCIREDIVKCKASFSKQFNSVMSKFGFMPLNVLTFLFKSYCSSFYGMEFWSDFSGSINVFDQLTIFYHKAVKRIAGLPMWESNHLACSMTSLPIFKHYVNLRLVNFLFNVSNSKSPCVAPLKSYFRFDSYFKCNICKIFKDIYDVDDIFDQDIGALRARIDFVQRHEESSINDWSI